MASMWRIVPQIVRRRGEEVEVNVKLVSYYPQKCRVTNRVVGFGRLADPCQPWQVIIQRYNWGDNDQWRIQWNPTSGLYRIVYNVWLDRVDPKSRWWKGPNHVIERTEEDSKLSLRGLMAILATKVGDPTFEGLVNGTLHSGAAQAAA